MCARALVEGLNDGRYSVNSLFLWEGKSGCTSTSRTMAVVIVVVKEVAAVHSCTTVVLEV